MSLHVYRDIKTQKGCEQGGEVNVGPKNKHTSYFHITLQKYSSLYFAL